MEEKIEFEKLGFNYYKTPFRFVKRFSNGKWDNGYLSNEDKITLSESACVFQYAQTVFEGLKAYRSKDNKIIIFRPDMNAKRMISSCQRMVMPVIEEDEFLKAVKMVVSANKEFVPDYSTGASLYLRPFMIGTNPVLGVKPATDYEFRIFASPVGPYFKGKAKSLALRISDYDRAAPHGTGHIKAGLNYAMSLYPITDAHENGFDENVYLDSATREYIEETGGANIIFFTKEGKLVTPKSSTILPSITRNSLIYVAKNYLGYEVEERRIKVSELNDFVECGLCGTAAVISPVGSIDDHGNKIIFKDSQFEAGKYTSKLLDTLRKIQTGQLEAPEGWIMEIEG